MTSKLSKIPLFRFFQSTVGKVRVVFFIFNILALSGIVYFFHTSSLDYFVQKYPLLDPMRHFLEEKNIITTLQPIRLKYREIVEKN